MQENNSTSTASHFQDSPTIAKTRQVNTCAYKLLIIYIYIYNYSTMENAKKEPIPPVFPPTKAR